MLATVAMVVPSLKVLDMVTELPTFTGTSRMRPEMVERMSVVLPLLLEEDTPSRTISRVSLAMECSSCACRSACDTFSKDSALTRFWSKSLFSRS